MLSPRSALFFPLIICIPVIAQKIKKADKVVMDRLEAHTGYLTGERIGNGRAGSIGEKLATEYIKDQFQQTGLTAKGENGGFYQTYDIPDGRSFSKNSYLFLNDKEITRDKFFPAPFSPETTLTADPSIALKEVGVPWFLDIREDMQAAANNPQFSITPFLTRKAKDASKKGATALFIYNSDSNAADLQYDARHKSETAAIPVIFISNAVAQQYFKDETATLTIKLRIQFSDDVRTGRSVIGYLDKGAPTTVVVGAHLYHGEPDTAGTVAQNTGILAADTGENSNASGIAALIELSRMLKSSGPRNNFLFIAFSEGAAGARYFAGHPTIDLSAVSYMLNIDRIDGLNDSVRTLTVGGSGSSNLWPQILKNVSSGSYFIPTFDSSDTGYGDHISFYKKGIPALVFYTGLPGDYHKPVNSFNKVNYTGEYRILQYIYRIAQARNKSGKPAFTKTKEPKQTGTSARFTVR